VDDRPNLVLFMPDQLRADALGCFGSPVARTPNVDALAARGTRFAEAYAQHPVCGPSRVSIMTGWYPHTHGHLTLTNLLKPWHPNLLRLLRDAGYHVAWAGHRGDTFAPGVTEASTDVCGWLERPETLFMEPPHPPGSKLYDAFYHGRRPGPGVTLDFDEAATRTAERWLAEGPPEPWCLFVALIFPHLPFEVEEPWFSLHERAAMPAPVPVSPSGKPAFQAAMRERLGLHRLTPDDWAEIAAVYHGMVSRVDDQLGRVLDAVDRTGAADRTATFFFTDHGEYLGDQGLVEKWPSGLDDCLVRNPLVAHVPGGAAGQVCPTPVELVDLLPTLLELGGTEARHTHFGRSLVPLLHDATRPHRDAAFSEGGFRPGDEHLFERPGGVYRNKGELQHERPELVGTAVSIRTGRWTYVLRRYEDDELYDRAADPDERTNLVGSPDTAGVERELRERILDWLLDTTATIPWDPDPRAPRIPHGRRDEHPVRS
jgi:arylsulfatase A-like enzyme